MLNNGKENLGKFDAKVDEGIFFGYSSNSKAYRIYNKRTMTIEESIHVTFDESNPKSLERKVDDLPGILEDMGIHEERRIEKNEKDMPEISTHIPTEPQNELPKEWRT